MSSSHFIKGGQVEVMKQVNGFNTLTYYPATVLRLPSNREAQILIEYNCSLLCDSDSGKPTREMVDFACLRPMPPKQVIECFKMGDSVDVFCDNGWQKGTIKDLLENSKYVVGFDGKSVGIVAEQCNLRLHREWNDGSWVPPFVENKNSSDRVLKPRKVRVKVKCKKREPQSEPIFRTGIDRELKPTKVRLKIKCKKRGSESEPIFRTGTRVEVRSDEEGYVGAWYDATIVGIIGNDKYLVEYMNLLTDNETELLREMVTDKNTRPCPPPVPSEVNFQLFEYVDAWYNDGWWEGVVSEVLNGSKYKVFFSSSNETLEFTHSLLRHHQEWIDGEWKKKEKSAKLEDIKNNPREMFAKGTKVEVRSDEVGFQGAWFGATIVDVMEGGKFVVQYHDLIADDGTDFLKEEANASDIRPSPPPVQHLHPFRLFELVDAWYNDGWWVGHIDKVHTNSKYTVHFKNTEDLEFEHHELRPHQEYIGGNWVTVPMDWQL